MSIPSEKFKHSLFVCPPPLPYFRWRKVKEILWQFVNSFAIPPSIQLEIEAI